MFNSAWSYYNNSIWITHRIILIIDLHIKAYGNTSLIGRFFFTKGDNFRNLLCGSFEDVALSKGCLS